MIEQSLQLALDSAPFLLKGAYYTVILSVGGMFFGLLLGFGLALMRLSPSRLLSWPARDAAAGAAFHHLLRPAATGHRA